MRAVGALVSRHHTPIDRTEMACFNFRDRFGKHPMRTAIAVAISAALLVGLSAGVEAGQTCISKATEALPRITGLVVKKSRTRPVSPEILASWKGQSRPIIVDVDVDSAGEAQTYSYMCVITQGSAFVQRTMN
jgi:hypothetical protein